MIQKIIDWFKKEENDVKLHLPEHEKEKFVLKFKDIEVGFLECQEGIWHFYYSDDFKKLDKFYPIIGFPDLNKKYTNESLWPFFQIRIPGLGQPAIKDILKKEKIDKGNEFALLKRFGYQTISNPYTLKLI